MPLSLLQLYALLDPLSLDSTLIQMTTGPILIAFLSSRRYFTTVAKCDMPFGMVWLLP